MKKLATFIVILIFSVTHFYTVNAQEKAVIYLLDGSEIEGFASIKKFTILKFWKDLNSKPSKEYDQSNVRELKLFNSNSDSFDYYEFKYNTFYKSHILVKRVIKGNISIYSRNIQGSGSSGDVGYNIGGILYYISKSNNNLIMNMNSLNPKRKQFAKAYTTYFGDCPDLMNKLENKEFKKWKNVVIYYNNNCSK